MRLLPDARGPLWVKREDCTGLAMGGNKVRQVERYIDDALLRRATVILVTGAVQSNFVRVVAAACAKHGLSCEIFLEDRVAGRADDYYTTGNVLLSRLLGATVRQLPEGSDERAIDRTVEARACELTRDGAAPYVISTAIEAPPLGALAYVDVAAELLGQARDLGVDVSDIVVATGTGHTQAGLLVGLRALESRVRVHGIAVRRAAVAQRRRVETVARGAEALLGIPHRVSAEDVIVEDRFLGPDYGQPSHELREVVRRAAACEGLLLDPVYSGRAAAGLVHLAGVGRLGPGATIFMHTGGAPALFAYPEMVADDPLPQASFRSGVR